MEWIWENIRYITRVQMKYIIKCKREVIDGGWAQRWRIKFLLRERKKKETMLLKQNLAKLMMVMVKKWSTVLKNFLWTKALTRYAKNLSIGKNTTEIC